MTSAAPAIRPDPPAIGLRTKAFYGFGAVAFGVKDNGFSYFLLLYYNQVVGLPASWVASALALALVVDAVVDLSIGQISDTWRSRLGRRHPFMYAAAVPVALSYMLLWNPPHASQPVLFGYLLGATIIVRTFIALYEIPSNALVPELTSDYAQRTSFFSYRFFFGWAGGMAMTLGALRLILRPDATHPVGQLNPAGYSLYGAIAGLVMMVSILAAATGTHRHIPYLRSPPPHRPFRLSVTLREMGVSLSNRSFLVMTLAALAGNMAIGLGAGLQVYLMTFFWELSADQLSMLLVGSFTGVAAGVIIAPRLTHAFGKRLTAVLLSMLSVIISFAPLVLRLIDLFPPNGSPALVPILIGSQAIATALGVAANVAISSMLADVVEESELTTGRRSEGLFQAANTFVAKCVTGVGIFATGLILTAVQFPEHARPGHVAPQVLHNLVLVYLPVQGALYFLAIFFLTRYRITRQSHEANLQILAARNVEAGTVGPGLPPEAAGPNLRSAQPLLQAAAPPAVTD